MKKSISKAAPQQYALNLAISIVLVCVMCLSYVHQTSAAAFTMQTGYYVGTGQAGLAISGLGFQPDFVMIKSTTAAGVAVFKTSAMPANTIAYTSATANDTGSNIQFTIDGFTLGTLANVNSANVIYNWIAIGGSDCTATGNFCVGTYGGNGINPRTITTNFQPAMVLVKRSTAVAGNFRVASEPANEGLYFDTTARNTTGALFGNFTANSFTVGATNNTAGGTYYFAAFAATAGSFTQGTYAGNGLDTQTVAGLGFQPNMVMIKNATSATANNRRPLMNFSESFGDSSSYVGNAVANVTNGIEQLQSDGFQYGSLANVNQNATTLYWFAFGGAPTPSSSGNFTIATGSYTGTGSSNPIGGVGFRPDLVIIKSNSATLGVFRTSLMPGDSTAYFSNGAANFANGITSLDADGFTVGTATQTNTGGTVYQWQAFGNAYNPHTKTGSNDFTIGAYYGNGLDNRNIDRLPWQPNMVTIKRNGASAGTWRSSAHVGDASSFFAATAEAANYVQALQADGFQIGANAAVNTSTSVNHWFAFKSGDNFAVGSYTGTGVAQNITTAGFRAENVWVKRNGATGGIQRSVRTSNNESQYFMATANATDRITGFVKGGFSVGGSTNEANLSGNTYRYAAWNDPNYGSLGIDIVDATDASVASPSFAMSGMNFSFDCRSINGSLGSAAQRIRISNLTATPGWSVSIAPTDGATALWRNVGDTQRYDFNDPSGTPNGCTDGGDADTSAGQLTIDPSVNTNTPEPGCGTTNISYGTSSGYNQSIVDSVELLSAGGSADTDCIWDITDIGLTQFIPAEQAIGSYTINMTVTILAQ